MSLSLPSRYIFSGSPRVRFVSRTNFCFAVSSSRRFPRLPAQPLLISRLECQRNPSAHASSLRSYASASSSDRRDSLSDDFDFGSFLAFAELLCVLSSAVIAVFLAVNYTVSGEIGRRVLAWGFVGLVGAVASGSWLRRRQWRMICRGTEESERWNLIGRLEKLDEDLRTSATIVRVLSRQLEKLGIRFRITRKSLKEPISETAALAQKNSEATRVLAAQQDILQKELGEIQKVLLAMQEQQRKQLDLIVAVTENGKLLQKQ
ncbi:PREDICTED: uncharacterized protein LOC104798878 [Tarenaya hassleriana]|uniref:uncharacterized protein LOC104798878 n=1 Tax=Tarenaya hassleriana TaxID=28532 RepID=UPI00053C3712|nr:PREDICTED: uncharacterized protein LOC104798878 [Tarenaya hassleriana]